MNLQSWHDSHHHPSLVTDGQVSFTTCIYYNSFAYTSRPCWMARTPGSPSPSRGTEIATCTYLHDVLFVASKICPRLLLSRGSGGWFGCQFFFFFPSLPFLLFSFGVALRYGFCLGEIKNRSHQFRQVSQRARIADQPRILGKR